MSSFWDDEGDTLPNEEKDKEQYLAKKFVRTIEEKRHKDVSPLYGLCSKCSNFTYSKTQYGKENIFCTSNSKLRPSPVDPIMVCSDFYPSNQLSLEALWAMATIISVDKKETIGFSIGDKRDKKE